MKTAEQLEQEAPSSSGKKTIEFIRTIQLEAFKAGMSKAAEICRKDIEQLQGDARRLKESGDKLNAYLYETQAMAHNLDNGRILTFRDNIASLPA